MHCYSCLDVHSCSTHIYFLLRVSRKFFLCCTKDYFLHGFAFETLLRPPQTPSMFCWLGAYINIAFTISPSMLEASLKRGPPFPSITNLFLRDPRCPPVCISSDCIAWTVCPLQLIKKSHDPHLTSDESAGVEETLEMLIYNEFKNKWIKLLMNNSIFSFGPVAFTSLKISKQFNQLRLQIHIKNDDERIHEMNFICF